MHRPGVNMNIFRNELRDGSRTLSSNLKIARRKKIAIQFFARCFTPAIKVYAPCISQKAREDVAPFSGNSHTFALFARYSKISNANNLIL